MYCIDTALAGFDAVTIWKHYENWFHWFELHVKILEQGNFDPDRLAKARTYLKAVREELKRREADTVR